MFIRDRRVEKSFKKRDKNQSFRDFDPSAYLRHNCLFLRERGIVMNVFSSHWRNHTFCDVCNCIPIRLDCKTSVISARCLKVEVYKEMALLSERFFFLDADALLFSGDVLDFIKASITKSGDRPPPTFIARLSRDMSHDGVNVFNSGVFYAERSCLSPDAVQHWFSEREVPGEQKLLGDLVHHRKQCTVRELPYYMHCRKDIGIPRDAHTRCSIIHQKGVAMRLLKQSGDLRAEHPMPMVPLEALKKCSDFAIHRGGRSTERKRAHSLPASLFQEDPDLWHEARLHICAQLVLSKKPLIFGLGHDSIMYESINDNVVFVEDSAQWIARVKSMGLRARVVHYQYETTIINMNDAMPDGKIPLEKLENELGDGYDFVLVQAPMGNLLRKPGRFQSVKFASSMKGASLKNVCVRDYDRVIERKLFHRYFGAPDSTFSKEGGKKQLACKTIAGPTVVPTSNTQQRMMRSS